MGRKREYLPSTMDNRTATTLSNRTATKEDGCGRVGAEGFRTEIEEYARLPKTLLLFLLLFFVGWPGREFDEGNEGISVQRGEARSSSNWLCLAYTCSLYAFSRLQPIPNNVQPNGLDLEVLHTEGTSGVQLRFSA